MILGISGGGLSKSACALDPIGLVMVVIGDVSQWRYGDYLDNQLALQVHLRSPDPTL